MTRLTGIGPVLESKDVEASVAWYGEMLGFEPRVLMRGHGPGQEDDTDDNHEHTGPVEFAILGRDEVQLFLVIEGGDRRVNNARGFDTYIWVDGVEELYNSCVAKGAEFRYPIEDMPYGLREFGLKTPDGHTLAIGGAPAI